VATKVNKNQFIDEMTSKRYESLDDSQKLFVDEWISAHYAEIISSFRTYAAIVILIGYFGTFLFLPILPSIVIGFGGIATTVFLYLWRFSSLHSDRRGQLYWYGMVISSVGSYALVIVDVFSVSEIGAEHFWATMGYGCTGFFMIVACPYFGSKTIISAFICIIAGYFAFNTSHMFNQFILFGTLLVMGGTGWVLNRMAFTYVVSEAYAQLVRRELLQQNENLIKENLEKDLYLAREVQDSFLPPAEGLKLPEGNVAKFFKSNSHMLGGDWMAYRMLADQTLVAMILDATGKGTAAALVVHAVQSLWVKSLSQPKFDIESWIHGVNRTLINFGHKSVHSVTMGIVAFRPGKDLTYYSCGHVPIFVTSPCHQRADGNVVSMTGGGDILGLKQNSHVGVAKFTGDISAIRSIFLGTDGIFPQGTRTNRRSVLALENHLVKQDESYLSTIDSKDDKLLLWIHREAA
jgi:uncharacterized membrane protein (DUF485 family)